MIDRFDGPHAFLSNFYPSVIFGGTARTVEHAFQAGKTNDLAWRRRILDAATPGQAKRLGRKAPLRPDWEEVRVDIMRICLEAKFADPRLDALLTTTQPHVLVEGNTWGDTFWGACWTPNLLQNEDCWADRDDLFLVGTNMLGQLLMEIRDRERG